MKTYKEMAEDALGRISQYETEKKNKRKKVVKIAAPAVCCCLVLAVCVGMRRSDAFKNGGAKLADPDIASGERTYTTAENETSNPQEKIPQNESESIQTDPVSDGQMIASDGESIKGRENDATEVSAFCTFWWKNRIVMYGDLYWALNDDPDGTFAVTAICRPTPANVEGFFYEGKSLFQLAVEADNERMLPEKMAELLKCGDELKYGTALYETGGLDGIKWDRTLYENQVAYFGDLLNKYIVDGEFLADALKKDIEDYNETSAARAYKHAYNAYLETVLGEAEKILSENHIQCERAPYAQNSLNIIVTAEQLENLPLKNIEFWVFRLTDNNLKGSAPAVLNAEP